MRVWPVILLALLVLPAASSTVAPVREVAFHQFQPIQFVEANFFSNCEIGGVEFDADARGFTFIEGMSSTTTDPIDTESDEEYRGLTSAGCGTMRKEIRVLPTADHLIVRFEASRERDNRAPLPGAGAAAPLIQDLVVRDAAIREIQSRAIFEPEEGSHPIAPFEFTFVGDLGGELSIDWVFLDPGFNADEVTSTPIAGNALSGTVRNASIEATGAALPSLVSNSRSETRQGTELTTQHEVAVQVPQFSGRASAVRVRVEAGLEVLRVIAPDGTDLGAPSTFTGGILGLDHDGVAVQVASSYVQAVVPQSMVDKHGAGQYLFVFEQSRGMAVSAALVPFSIVLLVTPLPFAVLAWVESRAFRREAFGGYARSARNLQYGVVLVFLYYAAVVASAAAGGRLDLMALVPLPLEGVLLYVQLLLAGVAFTALWLVARELYLLVKPRAEPGLGR